MKLKTTLTALFLTFQLFVQAASAEERSDYLQFENPISPCTGGCSLSVFAGIYSITGMGGVAESFNSLVNSEWGDGGILGVAASRRMVSFGDYLQIEGEIGTAKRFGNLQSVEIWGAVFFRWMKFPWDKYIDTSFALSTGLNYAFDNESLEKRRAKNQRRGSNLMHYLSPEIAIALPRAPENELFFRFHHRSGGAFILPSGGLAIFDYAAAGADYGTIGFRKKF